MNVKIVTNINTKCPCHVCKILSAFNRQWEVAERRSLTDVWWLCNWWRGTFIDTNDVVDDEGRAWIIDYAMHWKRKSERVWERVWMSVSVTCQMRAVLTYANTCTHDSMRTCRWILWVREWIEFANVNVTECECECVSVRVVSLADLLQQHGLPTPRAALSGGVWYCKCGMPDD